ncbi:MAG: TonB family protein [Burkholderiaceae bacterium]
MSDTQQAPRLLGGHPTGFLLVVVAHAALGWALLHGLGTAVIEKLKPPLDAVILDDPRPVPPPPQPTPVPNAAVPRLSPTSLPPIPSDDNPVATREPAIAASEGGAPSPVGLADTPVTTPLTSATPRMVAKPAIANVQACAPRGEDYPAAARKVEATGTTRLRFTIDAAGAVMKTEVVRPAGATREHRLLDSTAASMLAGCAFTAGIDENGRAVGGTFEVDYVWKLE